MISLNLLSYERRRQIEIQQGRKLVIFFAIVSFFLFAITVSMILVNVILAKKIGDLGVTGRTGETLDRVRALDGRIIVMEKLQDKFIFFTDSLVDFSKTVPAGVRVDTLILNKDNNGLRVKGVAATREDLINFKKNMETVGRFSEVSLSTEDISSKELVDFEMMAVINFSKLQ